MASPETISTRGSDATGISLDLKAWRSPWDNGLRVGCGTGLRLCFLESDGSALGHYDIGDGGMAQFVVNSTATYALTRNRIPAIVSLDDRGHLLSQWNASGPIAGGMTDGDGILFVSQLVDEYVIAYEAGGQEIWRVSAPGIRSSPVLGLNQTLYVTAQNGIIYSIH